MSRIRILRNPLDGGDALHLRTDDVLSVFKEAKRLHPQARIFLHPACAQNDVTPTNHVDIASLQMLAKTNDFDISLHAGAPAVVAWVAFAISLAMSVYTYMNMPGTPEGVQGSSNNELSNRTNRERIKGRVPDPFGRVKSIPDLIAPPFLYYNEYGTEVEECLMCIGRDEYLIEDIKDGDTYGSTIDGFATSVYAPGQSLISDAPQVRMGDAFTKAPRIAKKSSAVTGQTLPNATESVIDTAVEGTMYPKHPNRIYLVGGGMDAKFTAGESVIVDAETIFSKDELLSGTANIEIDGTITIATSLNILDVNQFQSLQINTMLVEDPVNGSIDLAGTYPILSINKSGTYIYEIKLSDFATINPNWQRLEENSSAVMSAMLTDSTLAVNISGTYQSIIAVTSDFIELGIPVALQAEWDKLQNKTVNSAVIDLRKGTDNWLGWFYINFVNVEELVFNFYYPKGMYSVGTNGKNYPYNSVYSIQYQELDENGQAVGLISSSTYMQWEENTSAFGGSKIFAMPQVFSHGVRVRVRKEADLYVASKTTRMNELKLKSVYACNYLEKLIYPEVTLVRSLTVATDGALSVKERQWNCIATRLLYSYESGVKSELKKASSDFADIVCALAIDPLMGRSDISAIDVQSLYATSNEITAYFGTSKAAEFNYTFDQKDTSFEESLAQIATCVNSNARRESSKIHFQFEKDTPNSIILFNHRNKQPFSETWSEKMGVDREYDGVEVTWIDPNDSWIEATIKLPDENISNPKKLELLGVTNKYQAHFIANRVWNKIKHQRLTVQFTAYGEADLVTLNDRIAITDDTTPDIILMNGRSSGGVKAWSGQNIRVSQPVQLDPSKNYTIHLQLKTRFVETMQVTQGASDYDLILERLPAMPLVFGEDDHATYSITLATEKDIEAFLVSEKSPSGQYQSEVTAINYDARYYASDKDFINNLI